MIGSVTAALVGIATALVVLVALACFGTGCANAAVQAEVAAYGGEQLTCVASASSRGQADFCRDSIRAYWCGDGGPLAEADACASARQSDGGHP